MRRKIWYMSFSFAPQPRIPVTQELGDNAVTLSSDGMVDIALEESFLV